MLLWTQRAHNHSCNHRAIVHAFFYSRASQHITSYYTSDAYHSVHYRYPYISFTCVNIGLWMCFHTMDAFREAFNMLIIILVECRDNYRATELMYNERYSNHPRKSHMAFCRFKNRFLWYDFVRSKKRRQTTIVNEEKAAYVIVYVTINSHASSRLIVTESRISQTFVIRILHNYKFYPYHIFLSKRKQLCKLR